MMCVDWSAGAKDPNYVRAAVNTRLVGRLVAILIENINSAMETRSVSFAVFWSLLRACDTYRIQ